MKLLILVIQGYRKYISPAFAPRCKYYPTCSKYAIDALREYGLIVGLAKSVWRVLRCNPFSYGGVDYAVKTKASN